MLFGVTRRRGFVDAPGRAADLKRDRARGYEMTYRVRLAADRPVEVVEVHPPSVTAVNMAGVTVEYYLLRPLPSN